MRGTREARLPFHDESSGPAADTYVCRPLAEREGPGVEPWRG